MKDETKAKISAAMKGKKNALGNKHSDETRAKMSAAHKGKPHSAEMKAKMSIAMKGKKNTLGMKHTAEAKAKISESLMGHECSPEMREKIGDAQRGPKSSRWLGGVSREPYGWEWNEELREEVRRRDGYTCQLCGASQFECIHPLSVHHIDYDKKNSDPVNLVALCKSCHMRTNINREHWTLLLQIIQLQKE